MQCGFIFTTVCDSWREQDFSELIYNKEYIDYDPDYVLERPKANASFIRNLHLSVNLEMLDFGCGNGVMLHLLRQNGYKVDGYDSFDIKYKSKPNKKYDFIMSFEVIEHTHMPFQTHQEMLGLLRSNGLALFSTLLLPSNIQDIGINWWYIAPRNGHISIHTAQSLSILTKRVNADYAFLSLNQGLHLVYNSKTPPPFLEFVYC